jgi:hypothetical protein
MSFHVRVRKPVRGLIIVLADCRRNAAVDFKLTSIIILTLIFVMPAIVLAKADFVRLKEAGFLFSRE